MTDNPIFCEGDPPPCHNSTMGAAVSRPTSPLSALALGRVSCTRCEEPPPPPVPDAPKDDIAKASEAALSFPNPGPYEQVAMDCKRLVMVDTYDGFRCDINKQVSPFMAAVHNFWLGTNLPDGRTSTYAFVAQVADDRGLLMSRVDPGRGSFDGRIHRALLGGLAMGKVQMSVSGDGQADQVLAEVDFGGLSWTGNLKYGSMGGGLVFGCNYLQSVTPKLMLGGEGMYIAANQNWLSNYSVKYTLPASTGDEELPVAKPTGPPGMPMETEGSSTMIAAYNSAQGAISLNYKRVITPNRVTVGAELQFSPLSLDSQLAVGAEFKLTRSKLQLCVDGTGRIQSLLEAKLGMAPGSPTLSLAADMNHMESVMKFGYGITVDG